MAAIGLWVRTTTRRHLGATVFLILAAGLSAGVVAASAQAARRSDGAVDRYLHASRAFDVNLAACPPSVNVADFQSGSDYRDQCGVDRQLEFAALLAQHPLVESTAVGGTSVIGLGDPTASNGWGRVVLTADSYSEGVAFASRRPIVVSGTLPNVDSLDEVVVGEAAARDAGIHVGDEIRIMSWSQVQIDAAVDGRLAPTGQPVAARVAAIVRLLPDVQTAADRSLTGTILDSYVYLGPSFSNSYARGFGGYGTSVLVRLRGGPGTIEAFTASLTDGYEGWQTEVFGPEETNLPALDRAVANEGRATWAFTAIAALASIAFVGLMFGRQLRRELHEVTTLRAVGFTRRDITRLGVLRALVVALPGALVAVAAAIALSSASPVGVARSLEFHNGLRLDLVPLLAIVCVVPVLMCAVGAGIASAALRSSVAVTSPLGTPRSSALLGRLGALPSAASSFVRGGSTRVAMGVASIAVLGVMGAAGLVASLDRVLDEPARYGVWWDVAVGQYSSSEAYEYGAQVLQANPNVRAAAGYNGIDVGRLDDIETSFVIATPVVGEPEPVVSSGRAPRAADEIAVGAATLRRLGKSVGDRVTFSLDGLYVTTVDDAPRQLQIVGTAVMMSPVETRRGAGEGAVLPASFVPSLNLVDVPQSIAVSFDPNVDRDKAIESLVAGFGGSMRMTSPQPDLANLDRLRTVPWLLSLLIVVLAGATVVHALVTLVQRHRRDLGVLSAMGLAPRQLRGVAALAGSSVVAAGVVVGLPLGVIVGRLTWLGFADRIDIPSGPVVSWSALLVTPVAALLFANVVTAFVSRRVAVANAARSLRSE